MKKEEYPPLVEFMKKQNPVLFNNTEELKKRLIEFDNLVRKETDKNAKAILLQGRNLMACALGEELLPEKEE
jgi:hypothetical protein